MKLLLAIAALAAAAFVSGAAACDIGRVPSDPARLNPAVIAVGHVVRLTVTPDDPANTNRFASYTAHADVSIERVPLGALKETSWRVDYPTAPPGDLVICELADGPNLYEGNAVALYFREVDGKLKLVEWFKEDVAVSADPRAGKAARP